MADDRETILSQLLSLGTSEDPLEYTHNLSPGSKSLNNFVSLLAKDPAEEDLQRFLGLYPQFLMATFGTADDGDIALLYKPRVGTGFVADFGILICSQGGCSIYLVEIEPYNVPLFTRAGTPSRYLQHALGQIEDWRQWINLNKDTFIRETVEAAKNAVPYSPEDHKPQSIRFESPERLQRIWNKYGGNEYAFITYAIIIGRWGKLSENHRRRLIHYNRQYHMQQHIYTYDQMARKALVRPELSMV